MPGAEIYVFLDTNILVRIITQGMPGCEMESWQEFSSLVEKRRITLLVPEVVLLELEKNWATLHDEFTKRYEQAQKRIDEQFKDCWSEVRDLVESVRSHVSQHKDDKKQRADTYHAKIHSFLNSEHAKTLALTSEILLRVQKRKLAGRFKSPDHTSGGDACIIESLAAFFDQQGIDGATLLFCSENKTDFGIELNKQRTKVALHPRVKQGLPPTEYFMDLTSLVMFLRDRKEVHEPDRQEVGEALEREKVITQQMKQELQERITRWFDRLCTNFGRGDWVPPDQENFDRSISKLSDTLLESGFRFSDSGLSWDPRFVNRPSLLLDADKTDKQLEAGANKTAE
jgi:hypothetical protein